MQKKNRLFTTTKELHPDWTAAMAESPEPTLSVSRLIDRPQHHIPGKHAVTIKFVSIRRRKKKKNRVSHSNTASTRSTDTSKRSSYKRERGAAAWAAKNSGESGGGGGLITTWITSPP